MTTNDWLSLLGIVLPIILFMIGMYPIYKDKD